MSSESTCIAKKLSKPVSRCRRNHLQSENRPEKVPTAGSPAAAAIGSSVPLYPVKWPSVAYLGKQTAQHCQLVRIVHFLQHAPRANGIVARSYQSAMCIKPVERTWPRAGSGSTPPFKNAQTRTPPCGDTPNSNTVDVQMCVMCLGFQIILAYAKQQSRTGTGT